MPFPSELTSRISRIISEHETNLSALLPVLREVQNELGWLSNDSMNEVAYILGIPSSSVLSVATFYTMYFTEPVGRHIIWQCRTLSCALRGAEHVEHYLCEKLGVKIGETTSDGKITVMETECLASCGTAPAMLVDDTLHENLTKIKIDRILEELKKD
ncbi:MAG: NADH-quinone oxidoreductase subunit NuoE [Thermodesulfobacteriota bacterium]